MPGVPWALRASCRCVAWARAKQSSDGTPDAGWLAIYSTDKQGLLTALTPRQEQEEEVVEGMFEGLAEDW